MTESDNGKSLSQRGNYSGSKIAPKRKAQIIALLGTGETVTDIARRTRACRNVIMAIRNANYNEIQQRKELLAAKAERAAFDAVEQIQDHLDKGKLSPQQLVPVFGVLVDKSLALRGDAQLRIAFDQPHQHIHAHISEHSYHDLLARLPRRNDAPEDTQASDSPGA